MTNKEEKPKIEEIDLTELVRTQESKSLEELIKDSSLPEETKKFLLNLEEKEPEDTNQDSK